MSVLPRPVSAGVIAAAGEEFDRNAEHFLTRYILERLIREMFPGKDPKMYPREEPLYSLPAPLHVPEDDIYRDAIRQGLLRVDKDPLGKPYLRFLPPGFCVSLSHCRYAAAAAAGSDVCGIDIERRFDWNEKLAARVFHHSERRSFERLALTDTQKRDLLGKLWSRKEAYLKCLGTGLRTDMRSICVLGENSFVPDSHAGTEKAEISGKTWYFTEQQNEKYTLCVCSLQKNIIIQTFKP